MMTRLLLLPALAATLLFAGFAAISQATAPQSWTIRYTVRGWSFWSVYMVDIAHRITLATLPEQTITTLPAVAPNNRAAAWSRSGIITVWPHPAAAPVELGAGDSPVWSPDSRLLVYHIEGVLNVVERTGDSSLSAPRRLVSFRLNDFGLSAAIDPVWSPDGEMLALRVTYRNTSGIIRGAEVFTISAAGMRQRKLGDDTFTMVQIPAWSPDGEQVVISTLANGQRGIFTLNANGLREQQHLDFDFPVQALNWSPDGTRIAFTAEQSGERGIYILELADGTLSGPLETGFGLSVRGILHWSPDSRTLAFVATDRGGIYTLPLNGGLPQQIANPEGYTELLP